MQCNLIVIACLSIASAAAAVEAVGGKRVGNIFYADGGSTVQRIGNTEYFSNGQNCTTIGSQVYCN